MNLRSTGTCAQHVVMRSTGHRFRIDRTGHVERGQTVAGQARRQHPLYGCDIFDDIVAVESDGSRFGHRSP
jgi:hypothetical protein